ncbi:MAG: aldehyde dehydrogenase [Eubacteriales bacterium]|nr:aldehyde dehydrogenase [Eubacteriales bacterium]
MPMNEIVERQREFFRAGNTRPYAYRQKMLQQLEKQVRKYDKEIQAALHQDLHKSGGEAFMTEIGLSLSEINHVRKHLKNWMRVKKVRAPLTHFPAYGTVRPEPYGVVLIMAPWNYPFLLNIEPLCDAIAAGNCCILKPSAYAPATSALLKKMIGEVFPPEYITVIEGGREENELLLEQRFDYIFFTGSPGVGKLVMEKAAAHLTPVTLELGGKSPCIVERTADINQAAKRIVFGKFINCGQTCVAPDYVLVHSEIKDEFIKALRKWITDFWGEHPLENPDYPRMISEKHFRRAAGLLGEGRIVAGGETDEGKLQITPTIIDGVKWNYRIMGEEIFGPILPVLEYRSLTETVDFLKNKEKPLALYLFTRSRKAKDMVLSELSFGGGCVNDTLIHLATPYMGFGGVGNSGMGAYHGKTGFDTFSHRKSILHRGLHPDIPVRYPGYGGTKDKIIRRLLR